MAASRHNYRDGPAPGPGTSSAAALELSYGRLTKTAARLFRLLPVNPGPDLSTAAAAALAGLPGGEVRGVLVGLAQAHLVNAAPNGSGRWQMHGLALLYAQQLSDAHAEADRREEARTRLLDYYLDAAEAADAYLRALPWEEVPEEFTSRDGALAWLDAECANLTAAIQMAEQTGRNLVASCLPLLLAQYFAWRRRFDDLLVTTTISLGAARRMGDRESEGDSLNNIGGALLELGRFDEAITAHQDAAAIYRESGNRDGEGDVLNNLGLAFQGVQQPGEAIIAHQDAAAIYQEIADRHGEGNALNNLGCALKEAGRFEEAVTAHRHAAAIYQETGDLYGQGVALNNLGCALREAGRFEEAVTAHRHAAAIFQEIGDRDREDMALRNLENAKISQPV